MLNFSILKNIIIRKKQIMSTIELNSLMLSSLLDMIESVVHLF